jgi:hypothetical protein
VTILDIEAYKAAIPQFNITYLVAPYKNTAFTTKNTTPGKEKLQARWN